MAEINETSQSETPAPEAPAEEPKKQSSGGAKSGTGLEPNIAALLAYLFGWLGGLIFFMIEKDNKFVRFSAMQSILFNVASIALWFVLTFVVGALSIATGGLGALFGLLMPLVGIGFLIIWIMLMVKAYNGEEWELPIIGGIARNAVNK